MVNYGLYSDNDLLRLYNEPLFDKGINMPIPLIVGLIAIAVILIDVAYFFFFDYTMLRNPHVVAETIIETKPSIATNNPVTYSVIDTLEI